MSGIDTRVWAVIKSRFYRMDEGASAVRYIAVADHSSYVGKAVVSGLTADEADALCILMNAGDIDE